MNIPNLGNVQTRLWNDEHPFLLVCEGNASTRGTPQWFGERRSEIRAALDHFGAILFRGFGESSRWFESAVDAVATDPLTYAGGVSPRSSVHGTVYTATDAPPALAIVQHHEMSYHSFTPRYIGFYCETPPQEEGATPLTDGRRLCQTLRRTYPEVIDTLEQRGVLFVRNYNEANFKGWQQAWQTDDRDELERELAALGMEWDWPEEQWLRTRNHVPALVRGGTTSSSVLFSCIHLWHRSFVIEMCKATGMPLPDDPSRQPYATFYGDGSEIPDDFIRAMHEAYVRQQVAVPYQAGDLLLVNNLLAAHGRQSYRPPRRVLVTMRESVALTDAIFCQPNQGS